MQRSLDYKWFRKVLCHRIPTLKIISTWKSQRTCNIVTGQPKIYIVYANTKY